MKILSAICCLVLLYGVGTASIVVEADQFEFTAALAFDKAIDIAGAGDRILVLSRGTLSVLDGATAEPVLKRVNSISIGREYSLLAADGDKVAVATRDGEISIYQLNGDALVNRAHYSSADSVIAMTLEGDALCLAQGYDGVRIVDVSDLSQPREAQILRRPDYSQSVDLADNFLYVLDALNGVEVYERAGDAYQFFDEILSDLPLTSISAHASGVAIAYGTERCEVWYCSSTEGCTLVKVVESEFAVSLISSSLDADTMIYLGSDTGALSAIGRETVHSSMPYPIDKILAIDQPMQYSVVLLDRSGNVTAYKKDPLLTTKVGYDAETSPSAIIAVDGGLLVSTAKGIQSLSFSGGNVDSRMVLPGAPVTDVLAESEEYIFAGSRLDGKVWRYVRERGRWKAHGEFETALTLRRLFTQVRSSGEIDLIAIGDEGIKCYSVKPDGSANATCSLASSGRIGCADVSDDWLVTTTEEGEVNMFAFAQGGITPVGGTRCTARPRDVVVTPEGVVVIAHRSGIDVLEFISNRGEFVAHESPAAISSAFDLSYDNASRELLVASGATPVKYLDFSDPTQLRTVFLVAGTEGTNEIARRDETLYCKSADWVRVYQRRNIPTGQQRASASFQSVIATPNPFNSDTQIAIQLTPNTRLPLLFEVSLVNLLGQTLSRREFIAFEQSIVIDLPQVIGSETELASGVYFMAVRTANEVVTRKLLLLK